MLKTSFSMRVILVAKCILALIEYRFHVLLVASKAFALLLSLLLVADLLTQAINLLFCSPVGGPLVLPPGKGAASHEQESYRAHQRELPAALAARFRGA